MPRDYYVILGIPADSTHRDIKAAYRRLAKEFHPDHRSDRHNTFLGIQEAYAVLGNPLRRKEYDATRQTARAAPRRRASPPSPVTVEPLIPQRPAASGPAPLRSRGYPPGPFDRLFGGASGHGARPEHLSLEVSISRQEARSGGVVRLNVPGRFPCQACGGSGEKLFHVCAQCGGSGGNTYDYPLRLEFPPGVPDNTLLRVALDSFGRPDASLLVRFRIRF